MSFPAPDNDPISRLPGLAGEADDDALHALADRVRNRGGELLNLHRVLAHSPDIAASWIATAHALRFASILPRSLAELVIVRTAQLVGSEYELGQHLPMALDCGVTQDRIDALDHWRDHDGFSERDRAALAYAEQVAGGGDVDDRVFAALEPWFTPCQIVELTILVAFYVATGLLLKSLKVKTEST